MVPSMNTFFFKVAIYGKLSNQRPCCVAIRNRFAEENRRNTQSLNKWSSGRIIADYGHFFIKKKKVGPSPFLQVERNRRLSPVFFLLKNSKNFNGKTGNHCGVYFTILWGGKLFKICECDDAGGPWKWCGESPDDLTSDKMSRKRKCLSSRISSFRHFEW